MRLTATPTGPRLLVRGYAEGKIIIDDQPYERALLLGAEQLISNFRPQRPEDLEEGDLGPVFVQQPEVVLIGWGGGQTFLPAAQRRWFLERGIGLEVMELGAACRTYNVLVGDGRRVMAILFPR
jgi:uncharacterized protein